MPLTLPKIDDRRYDDLVSEALARIPVHTPEWTNFNRSDPGVTLVELFAFLTENLLYRANQIPERNRKKFLQLLRVPLRPATEARGLVTITNESPSETQPIVLTTGLELRAGEIPFRTMKALDVLPVEGRLFYKKKSADPTGDFLRYYQQLYASYRDTPAEVSPQLYQSSPFPSRDGTAVGLGDTVDGCFWLALLARESDLQPFRAPEELRGGLASIRNRIARRTLTLGVVPSLAATRAELPSGRPFASRAEVRLRVEVPKVPDSGGLPEDIAARRAEYSPLEVTTDSDLLSVPGVMEVTLPAGPAMRLWDNIDPLEAGVNGLPPALEDAAVERRIVTWLRISLTSEATAAFSWIGINAVPVAQRLRVANELLANGTGEPDQVARLSLAPVLPRSVRLTVTAPTGETAEWTEIDDLTAAPPEVPIPVDGSAPGAAGRNERKDPANARKRSWVFALNPESGEVRFGDGAHGARPPENATLRASYDCALGVEGNVGAASIDTSPALPAGFKVNNPIPTWGGAEAESVSDGEKQISRYLQHRDRLVTANDFTVVTLRTPGVEIGRIEVLPNYHPDRGGAVVPGAVTLMLVPAHDPEQPDAPLPRKPFLDAVCRHLDPRRLVTTEIVLRGPDYRGIWISIGLKVAAGFNESDVQESVRADLLRFLAPTAGGLQKIADDPAELSSAATAPNGWILGKAVVTLELAAVAARTRGVEFVQDPVLLAGTDGTPVSRIEITGLELPRVLGIRVTNGAPAPLDELRGGPAGPSGSTQAPTVVQIPTIPTECR
ncbi:MAG: baseplate J/gp47 family protein [Thermoanaerobaculia bacterium]